MRWVVLAAAVVLAGCSSTVRIVRDDDGSDPVDYCEADFAPGCIVRGANGDTCQGDEFCGEDLYCEDSAEDFREWSCVAD